MYCYSSPVTNHHYLAAAAHSSRMAAQKCRSLRNPSHMEIFVSELQEPEPEP